MDIKVVLFTCDKCGKQNTLVAYHPRLGWYCKECLTTIRDRMIDVVDAIQEKENEINKILGKEEQ